MVKKKIDYGQIRDELPIELFVLRMFIFLIFHFYSVCSEMTVINISHTGGSLVKQVCLQCFADGNELFGPAALYAESGRSDDLLVAQAQAPRTLFHKIHVQLQKMLPYPGITSLKHPDIFPKICGFRIILLN